MSIIRVKKGPHPYVMLDTTALNDAGLSFRAKGLHAYLMAKPDDWQVYIRQLEHESPTEGRQAIASALKELESAGYIRRELIRGEKGHLLGWSTTVYETCLQRHSISTENGFADVRSPEVRKPAPTYYCINQGLNGSKDHSHKNASSCGTANGVAEPHPLVEVPEVATLPLKKKPRAITPLDETDWLWRELQHYTEEFALEALNDNDWWSNVANSFPLFAQEWVAPALADLAQWLQQNPQRVPRSPRGWKQRVSYSLNRAYDIHQRRQSYAKAPRRY